MLRVEMLPALDMLQEATMEIVALQKKTQPKPAVLMCK